MSGTFFGVYTLEMTQISQLMNNQEDFKFITEREYLHDGSSRLASTGYVDDINHAGSNSNKEQLASKDIKLLFKGIN